MRRGFALALVDRRNAQYHSAWSDSLTDDFKLWRAHDKTAENIGIRLDMDPSILTFGVPDPARHAYGTDWHDDVPAATHEGGELTPLARLRSAGQAVLFQVQQRRSWEHVGARSRNLRSYASIGLAAALDSLCWREDAPAWLSSSQQRELGRLRIVLAPRDLAFCRARADLAMRKTVVVHAQSYCHGCRHCPIINTRYDCVDCESRTSNSLPALGCDFL